MKRRFRIIPFLIYLLPCIWLGVAIVQMIAGYNIFITLAGLTLGIFLAYFASIKSNIRITYTPHKKKK